MEKRAEKKRHGKKHLRFMMKLKVACDIVEVWQSRVYWLTAKKRRTLEMQYE